MQKSERPQFVKLGRAEFRSQGFELVGLIRDEAVQTQTYHEPGNGVTTREQLPWRLTTTTTTHRNRQGNRKEKEKINKKRKTNPRETNKTMPRMSEQPERKEKQSNVQREELKVRERGNILRQTFTHNNNNKTIFR